MEVGGNVRWRVSSAYFLGRGWSARFARLKAHHERSLYRLTQKRVPQNACWVKKGPNGGRAKSPFPSRSREGSYPTEMWLGELGACPASHTVTSASTPSYAISTFIFLVMYQNVIYMDFRHVCCTYQHIQWLHDTHDPWIMYTWTKWSSYVEWTLIRCTWSWRSNTWPTCTSTLNQAPSPSPPPWPCSAPTPYPAHI